MLEMLHIIFFWEYVFIEKKWKNTRNEQKPPNDVSWFWKDNAYKTIKEREKKIWRKIEFIRKHKMGIKRTICLTSPPSSWSYQETHTTNPRSFTPLTYLKKITYFLVGSHNWTNLVEWTKGKRERVKNIVRYGFFFLSRYDDSMTDKTCLYVYICPSYSLKHK